MRGVVGDDIALRFCSNFYIIRGYETGEMLFMKPQHTREYTRNFSYTTTMVQHASSTEDETSMIFVRQQMHGHTSTVI